MSTPKVGAHWKVGVTRDGVIKHTATSTLRAFPAGGDYGQAEARHLGCSSTSSRSSTDRLIGQRKHVQIKQLLLYDDPAKSYINSLQTGQSFTVTKLSPTKTYAYGFAYGKINKHAWVRTSKLLASA